MDLYEYQARELLEEQGIPTPKAIFAQNSHEVAEAADQIGYPNVIKAARPAESSSPRPVTSPFSRRKTFCR